jgi:hypothetical protein
VKTVMRTVIVLGVAALLAASGRADEQKAEKKAKPKGEPFAAVFSFPKSIQLDDKQKEAVAGLKKEYTPQLEELRGKRVKIITPERQKAMAEAVKAAKAEGKKGKELNEARLAALKLTDEEKGQLKELDQAQLKLAKEIGQKKMALLTDEQKASLKPKKKESK